MDDWRCAAGDKLYGNDYDILEEIASEERVRNWEPYIEGTMNSHWDLVLYEWVKREKNLDLFLNTTMREW